MKELIEKIRRYCATSQVDEFKKALVETQISMLETDQITLDIFKINVSVLLDININDL